MGNTLHYAVLQRNPARPTPDQFKRAFKDFSHLTDADAVRLAVSAHGMLLKHLTSHEARALQLAFQAEGIEVAVVAEHNLPGLPEPRPLTRLELWPQLLVACDPAGHTTRIPWNRITLVAAGAAQYFEFNQTQTHFLRLLLNAEVHARINQSTDSNIRIEPGLQLLLELVLDSGLAIYEIDASELSFKSLIDRPGLAIPEKFIWLIRQICRETPAAILNHGADRLCHGQNTMPTYLNRQVLMDEIVWLLWQKARCSSQTADPK